MWPLQQQLDDMSSNNKVKDIHSVWHFTELYYCGRLKTMDWTMETSAHAVYVVDYYSDDQF